MNMSARVISLKRYIHFRFTFCQSHDRYKSVRLKLKERSISFSHASHVRLNRYLSVIQTVISVNRPVYVQ